jgi:hypothetical protein
MGGAAIRSFIAGLLIVLATGLPGSSSVATGQSPSAAVPNLAAIQQAWGNQSAADFLQSSNQVLAQFPGNTQVSALVSAEAARRLVNGNAAVTEQYSIVKQLVNLAQGQLTAAQKTALRTQLQNRPEAVRDLSVADLRDRVLTLKAMGSSRDQADIEVKQWLDNRDIALVPTADLEWCCEQLTESDAARNTGLSVRWTGTITPPQDGQYTFSGSSLRVNLTAPGEQVYMRSINRIWIDGQLVLDTSTNQPPVPVNLSASRPSTIQYQLDYEHSDVREDPLKIPYEHPPVAMLYWEGPGVQHQLVPASAFSPSQGTGPGLWGQYTVHLAPGQDLTEQHVDPQIDFAWTTGNSIVLRNADYRPRLVQELVTRYATPDYTQGLITRMNNWQYPIPFWPRMAELMTSAQRAQFLQNMTGNTTLLKAMHVWEPYEAYWYFRPGAEQQALDFLGQWMRYTDQANLYFDVDFFEMNRARWYKLADTMLFESPCDKNKWREMYLIRPDGSLSLWAAYTMAYLYAFTGKLDDWIAWLDTKLSDTAIAGDRKVDWLIARAQAEEIRGSVFRDRYRNLSERSLAGWGWLDEASLTAQSESAKLRVLREKVTRVAAEDNRDQAAKIVEEAKGMAKDFDSQQAIGRWQAEMERMAQKFDQMKIDQTAQAQASYLAELQRRRSTAQANNNSDAVDHYQSLIQAAQPKPASQ